jgi:hypothetical protein
LRESAITYEAVSEILRKHHSESKKQLSTREIRTLLGGTGSLTTISVLSKRYFDEHPSSSPVNAIYNDNLQAAVTQFSNLLNNSVRNITNGLEETIMLRDEVIESANSELRAREETIEELTAKLTECKDLMRVAEVKSTLLEEALAKARQEFIAEREKYQEENRRALQEAAFYRGKLEG